MKLQDSVIAITGGGQGLGRAMGEYLAAKGAKIALIDLMPEKLDEAVTACVAAGAEARSYVCNVAKEEEVEKTFEAIVKDFGHLNGLVNNAGITRDNLLMRMKDDEWDDIINTNLTSIFRLSKACLRGMMKAKRGRFISIASVVGASGNAGQTNYAAAKAGIMGFSKSLAREVASRGITVNVVAPGFIATDMTKGLPDEQKDALLTSIPLNRLGSPEDIAAAVAFLASPGGAYVTGETLHVNGGMYMA